MNGGRGRQVPQFSEPMNSPYIEKTERKIYGDNKMAMEDIENRHNMQEQRTNIQRMPIDTDGHSKYGEHTVPVGSSRGKQDDGILLDLQLYDKKKPPPSTIQQKMASLPVEPIAITTPYVPPQMQQQLNNFMKSFYTPFIYKDYHINIGGPNADHARASMIYEDALPPPSAYTSYKTLRERNNLCQYIRNAFIVMEEGEQVNFDGGAKSLNARLKLIALNPYNGNQFSNNPYKSLPRNMMIFTSCYPIINDRRESTVQCKKDSVGINIRMYNIKHDEYQLMKNILRSIPDKMEYIDDVATRPRRRLVKAVSVIDVSRNKIEYNIWREIEYYKFVRDILCKQMIIPNFIQSYCYFMDDNSNIDFDKITTRKKEIERSKEERMIEVGDKRINKALVLLTESPNKSLYQWGENVYVKDRNTQRQTYSGFKQDNEWNSIIAQMLMAFYVMDKMEFTINEMTIENNFYVKDVAGFGGDGLYFWRYNVNNVEYYIPNYGSLLMIDSDYRDLERVEGREIYKIISPRLFGDNKEEFKRILRENAKRIFNENNFGQKFTNNGGVRPSEKIINLLSNINRQIMETKMSYEEIIRDNLIKYVHNRIGTPLKEQEKNYIRKMDTRQYRKGEMIVHEDRYDTYKFVLYLGDDEDKMKIKIATSTPKTGGESKEVIMRTVPKELTYKYSNDEVIYQEPKPGEPGQNLDYLLETYRLIDY